jgi:hypothetical protein
MVSFINPETFFAYCPELFNSFIFLRFRYFLEFPFSYSTYNLGYYLYDKRPCFTHERNKNEVVISKKVRFFLVLQLSKPRNYMEVSDQLDAPAALSAGKVSPVPVGLEAGWAPEPVWTLWSKEKNLPLQRIELRSSGP